MFWKNHFSPSSEHGYKGVEWNPTFSHPTTTFSSPSSLWYHYISPLKSPPIHTYQPTKNAKEITWFPTETMLCMPWFLHKKAQILNTIPKSLLNQVQSSHAVSTPSLFPWVFQFVMVGVLPALSREQALVPTGSRTPNGLFSLPRTVDLSVSG